ncbi:FAD-dependent oxidoreductase [Saccharopolyspora shandongensis]|uniref:flavin monoamine oxidase family protein n=1 Tax=Saccharopolyspora shandongensis TaxID=418495 RepID=UPI0033D04455
MAEELDDAVRLDCPVRTVSQHRTGVHVDFDGDQLAAQRVIVAIPPTLAGRLRYEPALPGSRDGAGVWTQYGAALAEPCGRIHWAGAETSDVWNGYMDGAVRSGHRAAAEVLAQLGRAARPLDYVDEDWVADEWAQGGYAAHMAPGVMTAYGDIIREPFGRIHWAGTETATESMGYFEGALQSGVRAAHEVIRAGG